MTSGVDLQVEGLTRHFGATAPVWWRRRGASLGPVVAAVSDVSFAIAPGRTLGLVGESGSGKSTIARMVVGLLAPTRGQVRVAGAPLQQAPRGTVQMVFQDPHASLNPRWRVGAIVEEPLVLRRPRPDRATRQSRVAELLRAVGLSPDDAERLPHQFSGGQRQRISIARALASAPGVLVCDEPTSALDVSVQAQVLNVMRDVQQRRRMACLFISHNLAVVRQVSDDVGVLYAGRLVEHAPAQTLFDRPRHPYTRLLLAAVPGRGLSPSTTVAGEPPDPQRLPTGCAFHPRCPLARARCRDEQPLPRAVDGVQVACHAVEERRD